MRWSVLHGSVSKSDGMPNEDSLVAEFPLLAVSDGAGGYGNYADKWSDFIVNHLPKKTIKCFNGFCDWYEPIACEFYEWADAESERIGGAGAPKFYEEGACATLAAVWIEDDVAHWITYGDSVVFLYDSQSDSLSHSPISLVDFAEPPFLLNCNNLSLSEEAFKVGSFSLTGNSRLFVASDALSHYFLATYYSEHPTPGKDEIRHALDSSTYNAAIVASIVSKGVSFSEALKRIVCDTVEGHFPSLMSQLQQESLLANDDFSFVCAMPLPSSDIKKEDALCKTEKIKEKFLTKHKRSH